MTDWNISSNSNPNALLIVAHPDDETIFCGGTMLTYPNWEWTVICMTSDESSIRYTQLIKAMEYFAKQGVNIKSCKTLKKADFSDQILNKEQSDDWRNSIKSLNLNPDIVFTHNSRGEYGHEQHIALNEIVRDLYPNVWEFICPGAKNVEQPYREKINVVPLTKDLLDKKMEIFNNSFTSELYIWRNLPDLMLYEFRSGPEIFTQ